MVWWKRTGLWITWALAFVMGWLYAEHVRADEITLRWENPANSEVCTQGDPITLTGVRIWQLIEQIDDPAQTSYVIQNQLPGDYMFAATAIDDTDTESRISGRASKIVTSFIAPAGATVYMTVTISGGYWLLPVGTVTADVACDTTQTVNGKYAIPLTSVTWSPGTTAEPLTVLSDCE